MRQPDLLDSILNQPKRLSAQQKAAVISKSQYVRIIAGAGAGKTETLTRRIVYLLLCRLVPPRSIVAFTFTEKAAQAIKARVYERVRQIDGEDTCKNLGDLYIGTIHGYCLQVLQDHFGYGGYSVLNENEEMAFLLREGWSLGLGSNGRYSENCSVFLKSVNVMYNEIIPSDQLKPEASDFLDRLEKYEQKLNQHRLLTFGRMIFDAVNKLDANKNPLSHIEHLIVDEYQDINRAQEKLVKILGGGANVFIVGDPRQCIYQWRGSDEKCFDDFSKHFNPVETILIGENRRSGKIIVEIANRFADTIEHGSYEHLLATRDDHGAVVRIEHETPSDEAQWIVSEVIELVKGNKCRYSDCAILLRSVSTSAEPFIETFKDRNVPYLVGGKVGLFGRDEAKAVALFFCWLWADGFWLESKWSRASRIQGEALLRSGIELWKSATGISTSSSKLVAWKKAVLADGFPNFAAIYHDLLVLLGFNSLNPEDMLHAPIMANLGRFSTLLAEYEASMRLGGNKQNWPKMVKGLCWFINNYASGAYEEQSSEDMRGINAVQIMTIHQAKGLEWPVVFIPALVDKRFPSSRVGNTQNWHIPRQLFDVDRYEGRLDDERKLFYVTLTRARDAVCISYFNRMGNRRRRSPFVVVIEDRILQLERGKNLPVGNLSGLSAEDEIQTFSASEILTYLRCPYFYKLRQIWHYKPGLVEALGYGRSLHDCLTFASQLIGDGIDPVKAVEAAVETRFHVPYAGKRMRENMEAKASNILENFIETHKEDMLRIKEVEARLEFPIDNATITGRVDVILNGENSIEVRDYKTSDEVVSLEQASLQVQLYALGLQIAGMQVDRASIAYLDEAQIREVSVKEPELIEAREKAEQCIRGIKTKRFQSKLNEDCKTCDHIPICIYYKSQ